MVFDDFRSVGVIWLLFFFGPRKPEILGENFHEALGLGAQQVRRVINQKV